MTFGGGNYVILLSVAVSICFCSLRTFAKSGLSAWTYRLKRLAASVALCSTLRACLSLVFEWGICKTEFG